MIHRFEFSSAAPKCSQTLQSVGARTSCPPERVARTDLLSNAPRKPERVVPAGGQDVRAPSIRLTQLQDSSPTQLFAARPDRHRPLRLPALRFAPASLNR